MLDRFELEAVPDWAEQLKQSGLPVFIYGMGDGCVKVLRSFDEKGVKCSGIFVSDDFKRDREFMGFKLKGISELESEQSNFAIACAFGTNLPEVMARIKHLSEKHLLVFPETAVIGDEFFDKTKLFNRYEDICKVYDLLCDNISKSVFVDVLKFRISGDINYLDNWSEDTDIYSLLNIGQNEIYADLGAYNGDTIQSFTDYTQDSYQKIYAFEPSRRNFSKCVRSCLKYDNIIMINAASSDKDKTVYFSTGAGRQQTITSKGTPVAARSLDSVLEGKECTYIKYDVEGEDANSILGSRFTINKYLPKIRCGIYHRPYDILDIPLLLHRIEPRYKLYMRRPQYYPAWDLELLAVPN